VPVARIEDTQTYYEVSGDGPPLVLLHGAFVDGRMWDPQFEHFANRYRVVRYDLRGHGRTGPSDRESYSIELFADDLKALLDLLGIERATVCGLSLGGMVGQSFAVKYPGALDALVLSDTAVSVSLTWTDRLQRYVLAPKWAMLLAIRLMSVRRFVEFSFWLSRVMRSEDWFGRDPAVRSYVEGAMLNLSTEEYLKIYDAIYDFGLLDLARIEAPTLILNGEHESKSTFRHAREMERLIPDTETKIIPRAGHVSNMENPEAFNAAVEDFVKRRAVSCSRSGLTP
jgi:pimeloyl-ACP methyl ester carboxylesterase